VTLDGGGACHDIILKLWPELAPVVALHLSDDRGVPMHFEANGLYHLGFSPYTPPKHGLLFAARHFRISVTDAERVKAAIACAPRLDGGTYDGYDPKAYANWCNSCLPRYQQEADAAIALLDRLIAEQENLA